MTMVCEELSSRGFEVVLAEVMLQFATITKHCYECPVHLVLRDKVSKFSTYLRSSFQGPFLAGHHTHHTMTTIAQTFCPLDVEAMR